MSERGWKTRAGVDEGEYGEDWRDRAQRRIGLVPEWVVIACAVVGVLILVLALLATGPARAGAAERPVRDYPNCTALNRDYPHGVGLRGARDHTSGDPVTNFRVAPRVYRVNDESDADDDGIACEKH